VSRSIAAKAKENALLVHGSFVLRGVIDETNIPEMSIVEVTRMLGMATFHHHDMLQT